MTGAGFLAVLPWAPPSEARWQEANQNPSAFGPKNGRSPSFPISLPGPAVVALALPSPGYRTGSLAGSGRRLISSALPALPCVLALWPSKCQLAFPPNKGWYFSSVLGGDFPLAPSPR